MEFWKFRRELQRFGKQICETPEDLINHLFATRRYDRQKEKHMRWFEGNLPKSNRIAIFLIFPKSGLLASHMRTLEYFRDKGYSTLVVTNLPLSPPDRSKVAEICWKILERPNFGYDFGGYRDGLLSLKEEMRHLERLVLINDSVWFPLPGGKDWLDDVEALDVDFAGAASNFGTPRPDIQKFRDMRWTYSTHHKDFHICSFALCLGPKALQDSDFIPFWKRLRLTDKKKRTVRRGEIGFTQWALARSLRIGTTLDIANLDQELAVLSDEKLHQVACDLIIPENPKLARLWAILTTDPKTPREDLEKLILVAVSRQSASYALAAYTIEEKGFPFLKKSPLKLSQQSEHGTFKLVAKTARFAPIRKEIEHNQDEVSKGKLPQKEMRAFSK